MIWFSVVGRTTKNGSFVYLDLGYSVARFPILGWTSEDDFCTYVDVRGSISGHILSEDFGSISIRGFGIMILGYCKRKELYKPRGGPMSSIWTSCRLRRIWT